VVAVIGAVSAQDVMARYGVRSTVGYTRVRALVDRGLMARALERAGGGPRRSAGGEISRCRGAAGVLASVWCRCVGGLGRA